MCKSRQIFKNLLPGIVMLLCASLVAQEDKLSQAQQLYRAKNTELARSVIDSVIVHPQTKDDFVSWTTRAFIYFDIYRRTDKFKLYSPLRDTIISSLLMSNKLKPDSTYLANNKTVFKNLAAGYFNLAKTILEDSINYDRSMVAYTKYKEVYSYFDPQSADSREIEYYLAVGSVYSEIFIKDNNNIKAGDIAKVALLKVMEIQPDNANANINMGLMYYNQAVNLSKSLDYGADFTQIDLVQENMVKLAKQSEQFIAKVYNNDNKNLKAIEALYYIYRMLLEQGKSDDFKKKGEALGIKFDPVTEEEKGENKDKQPQTKDK